MSTPATKPAAVARNPTSDTINRGDLDSSSAGNGTARSTDEALLVEDVLLLLFQPESGTIAGENILFYVLGGAVLADLAPQGANAS